MKLGNTIVYASYKGIKGFKAFSIEDGCCVGNIINASTIENTKNVRENLQAIAEENKEIKVVFQLRDISTRKVLFQTV